MKPTPDTGSLFAQENLERVEAARRAAPEPAAPPPVRAAAAAPAMGGGVKIIGRVERVLFEPDRDRPGDTILAVVGNDGKRYKLIGPATGRPSRGSLVEAEAVEVSHPKYGPQFRATYISDAIPTDTAGIVEYLAREVDGIGRGTAERIVAKFGRLTYDILDNHIHRITEVPGVGETRARSIKGSWKASSTIRRLWQKLAPFGLPGSVPALIFKRYKEDSIEVVTQRPYELLKLPGLGFKRVDVIALAFGMSPDSSERVGGAVDYVIDEAMAAGGHTAVPLEDVMTRSVELTGVDRRRVEEVAAARIAAGAIVRRRIDGDDRLSLPAVVSKERAIASDLRRLSQAGTGLDAALRAQAAAAANELGDAEQASAVSSAFGNSVSIITGRPGCGKTTVTRVIAKVAMEAGLSVVMAAPTGKAARRMTEATGCDAVTIHALLQARPGSAPVFRRNNPLSGDVFIIDEVSMNDTDITAKYLEAIPLGARLVMVGDPNQLASVAPGNVLADLIASGVLPVVELKTVHRTSLGSDIVRVAHQIIDGRVHDVQLRGNRDFRFRPAVTDEQTMAAVVAEYADLAQRYGVDGVQVMTARRGTALGVFALNDVLRDRFNPAAPGKAEADVFGTRYRVGDRVIRTQTDQDLGVANGEVGRIVAIDSSEGLRIVVRFGERDVAHTREQMAEVELAYAITSHKSQGSEYPAVIVVVPRAHKFMLNRNLLYTAVTRGKKDVRVVGAEDAVRAAIAKPGAARLTGLVTEIGAEFGALAPRRYTDGEEDGARPRRAASREKIGARP